MFTIAGKQGSGTTERAGAGVRPAHRGGRGERAAGMRRKLALLWGWLTQTGYRPELHYMRGGRSPKA